jgi:hypothetical protein
MTAMDLVRARFATAGAAKPFYESFYLTAHDPQAPRALWIRYTVWKAPGRPPVGSVWRTFFDLDGPHADKWSTPDLTSAPLIGVGPARLEPDRAIAPDWEIAWTGDSPLFAHLPLGVLYGAPLPRTKSVSLRPRVTFSGGARMEGRSIDLTGWTGMLGHNWGSEHAERWIWIHGAGPGWLLDMVLGRLKVGPATTPWTANGLLEIEGRRTRVGGLGRPAHVIDREDGCRVRVSGLEIAVDAPVPSLVGWTYSDPAGGHHDVLHSSVATMTVRTKAGTVGCAHSASYEIGRREPPTLAPVLPFSDP